MPDFLSQQLRSLAEDAEQQATPVPAAQIRAEGDRRTRQPNRLRLAVAAVIVAIVAVGATLLGGRLLNSTPDPATTATPSPTHSGTPTTSPSQTSTPVPPATPSADPTTTPDSRSTPSGQPTSTAPAPTLTQDNLPGENQLYLTQPGDAGAVTRYEGDGQAALNTCQLDNWASLKPMVIWQAVTSGKDGNRMAAVVMEFADDTAAQEAERTVKTWMANCPRRGNHGPGRTAKAVYTNEPIAVPGASAALTEVIITESSRDEGTFDSSLVLRSGARLEVLTMQFIGQDHNVDLAPGGPTGQLHRLVALAPQVVALLRR